MGKKGINNGLEVSEACARMQELRRIRGLAVSAFALKCSYGVVKGLSIRRFATRVVRVVMAAMILLGVGSVVPISLAQEGLLSPRIEEKTGLLNLDSMSANMINIAPMIPGREKEIGSDIRNMFQKDMIQSCAFIFTLVPEGNPVTDKATRLASLYRQFRAEIEGCDMPVGILIQATIGHGWIPDEQAKFQKFTYADDSMPYIFCPLDPEFLAYIKDAMEKLSELKPDFFMLDDDTRMLTGRGGCFCPLHLAEFNRRQQTNYTALELRTALLQNEKLAREWDSFEQEGLVALARIVREAFDQNVPQAPGMFCACAGDIRHAPAMALGLAAPGQKPVVRINNACYLRESMRTIPDWIYKTTIQLAALPDNFIPLAETDTCPQNRYSTSAAMLHLVYARSLLAGCKGGKLWVTRTSDYQPASGTAYRNMLAKYAGFYREIAEMEPEPLGVADPLPHTPPFNAIRFPSGVNIQTWGTTGFGLMGIPFAYIKDPSPEQLLALAGDEIQFLSDAELKTILSRRVLLDGSAAHELTKRGFAKELGLRAEEWNLAKATYEQFSDGTILRGVMPPYRLKDIDPQTKILSRLYHAPFAFAEKGDELAPGAVRYTNELGGTITTLSGRLISLADTGFASFGMYNQSRKEWLVREMEIPFYYPGDAPINLTVFRDNGVLSACVINLGFDLLEELELAKIPPEIKTVEMLQPDGSWKTVPFINWKIQTELIPLQISFFRFREG